MASSIRYVGASTAAAKTYVQELVGADDFLRVFDRDGDGAVAADSDDEKGFVRAVCQAETEVDEALAASHGTPFTGTIPDSVREISALRCFWCAMRTRPWNDTEKAPFRVLHKDTDTRLDRIKKDNGARIPEKGAPEPTASVLATPATEDRPPTFWGDAASGRRWSGF